MLLTVARFSASGAIFPKQPHAEHAESAERRKEQPVFFSASSASSARGFFARISHETCGGRVWPPKTARQIHLAVSGILRKNCAILTRRLGMLLTVRVLYAWTAPRWPGAAILASAAATVATLHLNRPELVAARSLWV